MSKKIIAPLKQAICECASQSHLIKTSENHMKIIKRPENCDDCSNLYDFATKSIALMQINFKTFSNKRKVFEKFSEFLSKKLFDVFVFFKIL